MGPPPLNVASLVILATWGERSDVRKANGCEYYTSQAGRKLMFGCSCIET